MLVENMATAAVDIPGAEGKKLATRETREREYPSYCYLLNLEGIFRPENPSKQGLQPRRLICWRFRSARMDKCNMVVRRIPFSDHNVVLSTAHPKQGQPKPTSRNLLIELRGYPERCGRGHHHGRLSSQGTCGPCLCQFPPRDSPWSPHEARSDTSEICPLPGILLSLTSQTDLLQKAKKKLRKQGLLPTTRRCDPLMPLLKQHSIPSGAWHQLQQPTTGPAL